MLPSYKLRPVPIRVGAVYDSATRRAGAFPLIAATVRRRGAVRVLVHRELLTRTRRLFLGLAWNLLGPVLTTAVMWLVFSNIFRGENFGVPYVIYLLSGVIVFTLFASTMPRVAETLIANEGLLLRIRIGPELLAVAGGIAAAVGPVASLLPLAALLLFLQVGIPVTIPLDAVILSMLLLFSIGMGMLVSAIAVRIPDALGILAAGLQLLGFLTPTFYPLASIPASVRSVININPLTHFLGLFRDATYAGQVGAASEWLICLLATALALGLGAASFSRAARHSITVVARR